MNTTIHLVALFFMIGMAAFEIVPLSRSWLKLCSPCASVLQFCEDCIKGYCLLCVNQVDFTYCGRCSLAIIEAGENIYCDGSIEFHRAACQFSCRSRQNVVGLYNFGTCSASTDKCTCHLN